MRTVFAFCFLGLLALLGGAGAFACLEKYRTVSWNAIAPNDPIFASFFARLERYRSARDSVVEADVPIVTSFRALYPFENELVADKSDKTLSGRSAPRRQLPKTQWSYRAFVRRLTAGVDKYMAVQNPLLDPFRNAVGAYEEIVGNDIFENGGESIVRLDNGYYAFLFPYSDSANTWGNIREFAAWLKERNIRCVHLLPPYKFDDRVTVFPEGVPHGYARMLSEYQQFLSDNGIPYLDAANVLLAENPNFYDWFYKAANFHTAHAGLTIAQATAQDLTDKLGIAADAGAVKAEEFTRSVYPGLCHAPPWVWGGNAEGEDFEVLYPKKDGRFHVEAPGLGLDRIGGFSETVIAQDFLNSSSCYRVFLYGYTPLVRVENLTCTNNTRVLVLRRCNVGNICSYLACTVRHLDVIFPPSFDGSIRTFIEKTKPDVVMFCTYMQREAGETFWRLK